MIEDFFVSKEATSDYSFVFRVYGRVPDVPNWLLLKYIVSQSSVTFCEIHRERRKLLVANSAVLFESRIYNLRSDKIV